MLQAPTINLTHERNILAYPKLRKLISENFLQVSACSLDSASGSLNVPSPVVVDITVAQDGPQFWVDARPIGWKPAHGGIRGSPSTRCLCSGPATTLPFASGFFIHDFSSAGRMMRFSRLWKFSGPHGVLGEDVILRLRLDRLRRASSTFLSADYRNRVLRGYVLRRPDFVPTPTGDVQTTLSSSQSTHRRPRHSDVRSPVKAEWL